MELLKTTTGLDVETLIQKYAGTTAASLPPTTPVAMPRDSVTPAAD